MTLCFLDASAWLKRYTGEPGWEPMEALFDEADAGRLSLASAAISHAELISALARYRNRTALPDEVFDAALRRIAEDEAALQWLSVPEAAFWAGTKLIVEHNLNASDAALLASLLELRDRLRGAEGPLWLVTSDRRLLRASMAEGLACIDPEASSVREVRSLVG